MFGLSPDYAMATLTASCIDPSLAVLAKPRTPLP
jgi:hypothetical protein